MRKAFIQNKWGAKEHNKEFSYEMRFDFEYKISHSIPIATKLDACIEKGEIKICYVCFFSNLQSIVDSRYNAIVLLFRMVIKSDQLERH